MNEGIYNIMLNLIDTLISKLTSSRNGRIFLVLLGVIIIGGIGYAAAVELGGGDPTYQSAQTRAAAENRTALKAEFLEMWQNDQTSVFVLGGLLIFLLGGFFLSFSGDTTRNRQHRNLKD